MKNKEQIERIKSGLIGFAVGDALGVPIEFTKREKLQINKVTAMLEYRSHNVPKGSWSDDTSLIIATIEGIIKKENEIDYNLILEEFINWADRGEYCSNDKPFGIGRTTLRSLYLFKMGYDYSKCGQNKISDNGNGSLMRILPIAYYCYYIKMENKEIYKLVKNISELTHSHEISILGCYIYTIFIIAILNGKSKEKAYEIIRRENYSMFNAHIINKYKRILKIDIRSLSMNDISSQGFIIDTLEAVLWCFLKQETYKSTIIEVINLGNDTDTIGALTGGISGIYYGYKSIPTQWINDLKRKNYLLELCNRFHNYLMQLKNSKI